ncbi:hypothetical protein [Castellaniella sp.]|uniref:hypothetical protein n=1 Tax=Castellaniella sp. TaxID=1955812 RepID=UPI002AFF813B|nr:hypothetical protein [Castellaniella sp.]
MAMKDWSFGKLVGIFFGGLVGVIGVGLLAVKMISGDNASQSVEPRKAPVPTAVTSPARAAAAAPKAPSTVSTEATQIPEDIVSVQLESTQKALREAQESALALEKRLAQALAARDEANAKQIQALRGEMQSLNKRLLALEQDRLLNTNVQIIRPSSGTNSGGQGEGASTAASAAYTPPKGFVVRATMGDRVWLSDGTREISVLKGQEPPKPSAARPEKPAQPRHSGPAVSSAQP